MFTGAAAPKLPSAVLPRGFDGLLGDMMTANESYSLNENLAWHVIFSTGPQSETLKTVEPTVNVIFGLLQRLSLHPLIWAGAEVPWLSFGDVGGLRGIRGWAWAMSNHRLEGSRPKARCTPQAARLQAGCPLQRGRLHPLVLARPGRLPWLSFGDVGGLRWIRGWSCAMSNHRLERIRPRTRCITQARNEVVLLQPDDPHGECGRASA